MRAPHLVWSELKIVAKPRGYLELDRPAKESMVKSLLRSEPPFNGRSWAMLLAQHNGAGTTITVNLLATLDGGIAVEGHDVGEAPRRSFGTDDYEYKLTIPSEGLQQLAFALLKERLAGDLSALTTLRSICNDNDVPVSFASYP